MNRTRASLSVVLAIMAGALVACGPADGDDPSVEDPSGDDPAAIDAAAPPLPSTGDAHPGEFESSDAGTAPAPTPDAAPSPAPQSCTGKVAMSGDHAMTLEWGGETRTFKVHVPTGYDPTRPTPVVLNFHPYTLTGALQETMSGMTPTAEANGFVVVYPDGLSGSWNAGTCCTPASANNVDDVGFVGAVLDRLEAELCVDTARVYAAGFSNGGMLSNRLACELSDRIAAIVPVSGPIVLESCTPDRPVSILEFHGDADTIVPYAGSALAGLPAVEEAVAGWAERNGCSATATQTYQAGTVTCVSYPNCADGAETTLCTIAGGNHLWPAASTGANDMIWSFFQRHPLVL